MKHQAAHVRIGTADEFTTPNDVIPAGIICIIQMAPGQTALVVGDGVTQFRELPIFVGMPQGGPGPVN